MFGSVVLYFAAIGELIAKVKVVPFMSEAVEENKHKYNSSLKIFIDIISNKVKHLY